MIRMVAISFLLHVYGAIPSFAQADRWIWLGENILTQFERDTVITDNSHHMLSGFLDYRVRSIAFFGEFAEETTNRAGIILKAKSTTKNYKSGRAVIGKETDSCLVAFNIIVDEITHGRSAATSVGNLFSRKENKDYQDAPYSTIGPVASSGYIQYNTDSAVFSYTINYKKDRKKPAGWLVLHGDTLYVKPVASQIKKNGKIKKPDHISVAGLLLVKNDMVYAAIDQANDPYIVYIDRQLVKEEKLMIAAFFLSLPLDPYML